MSPKPSLSPLMANAVSDAKTCQIHPPWLDIPGAASYHLHMRSEDEPSNLIADPKYRELRLLSEVQHAPDATQRTLARKLGIALGLTNVLLKNLKNKGYVRVTQASWQRWLYALTPAGFTRKIQLTVAYIHRVLDHYHQVRQTLREELEPLELNEESRVALLGIGEFAEIVYLGLKDLGIEEIDVFEPGNPNGGRFLGMPVHASATLRPEQYDKVLVATLNVSPSSLEELESLGVVPSNVVTFFADGAAGREA